MPDSSTNGRERVTRPVSQQAARVRVATSRDRLSICALEVRCFGPSHVLIGPWMRTGAPANTVLIATQGRHNVGYVIAYQKELLQHPAMHVTAIGVHPGYRNQGIATLLMQAILAQHPSLWLHVRVGNVHAIGLYHKLGLREVLRQPHFYRDEDGLVMGTPDLLTVAAEAG